MTSSSAIAQYFNPVRKMLTSTTPRRKLTRSTDTTVTADRSTTRKFSGVGSSQPSHVASKGASQKLCSCPSSSLSPSQRGSSPSASCVDTVLRVSLTNAGAAGTKSERTVVDVAQTLTTLRASGSAASTLWRRATVCGSLCGLQSQLCRLCRLGRLLKSKPG